MTDSDLKSDMAAIKATLGHVKASVDRAEEDRSSHQRETSKTLGEMDRRLTTVEGRVAHIDRQMPQVQRSSLHDAQEDGWKDAKQDSQSDWFKIGSLLISALSLIVAALALSGVIS